MMFDVNKGKCINYQSSKVDIHITQQTMETMIKFINPMRMSLLHGKNKWVNLRKVMTDTWPRRCHHNVISFDE